MWRGSRLRLGSQGRHLGSLARGNDEGGLPRAPAVADAELDRRRVALLIEALQLRLVVLFKEVDWARVAAEKSEKPFRLIEGCDRDAGVVLHDRFAVIEQKIAHGAEAILKHQIGSRFEQAGRGALRPRKISGSPADCGCRHWKDQS